MFRFTHARGLVVLSLLVDLAACSSAEPAANIGNGGSPTGAAGSTATTGGGGTSSVPAVGGGGSSAGSLATAGGGGAGGSAAGAGGAGAGGSGGSSSGAAGAAGASGAGGSGGGASNAFTGTAKLMVLGSSNELQTCWRALFWKKLKDASIETFDLVGGVTQGPDDCGVAGYDKDLQAQSGIIVTNLTAQQFAGWFSAHPPDAVLAHFGGADLLANMPLDGIMDGFELALQQARLVNPQVRFLLAQHTPMTSAGCNDCANTVPALNQRIATWATEKSTAASPVKAIDLATGVIPATDTDDGVHLNMSGSAKVADRFYAAIAPFFGK